MVNKRDFRISDDKKKLHKIGKEWVTISALTLAILGGGMIAGHATHASVVQGARTTQLDANRVQKTPGAIQNRASQLHNRITNGTVPQGQNARLDAMPSKSLNNSQNANNGSQNRIPRRNVRTATVAPYSEMRLGAIQSGRRNTGNSNTGSQAPQTQAPNQGTTMGYNSPTAGRAENARETVDYDYSWGEGHELISKYAITGHSGDHGVINSLPPSNGTHEAGLDSNDNGQWAVVSPKHFTYSNGATLTVPVTYRSLVPMTVNYRYNWNGHHELIARYSIIGADGSKGTINTLPPSNSRHKRGLLTNPDNQWKFNPVHFTYSDNGIVNVNVNFQAPNNSQPSDTDPDSSRKHPNNPEAMITKTDMVRFVDASDADNIISNINGSDAFVEKGNARKSFNANDLSVRNEVPKGYDIVNPSQSIRYDGNVHDIALRLNPTKANQLVGDVRVTFTNLKTGNQVKSVMLTPSELVRRGISAGYNLGVGDTMGITQAPNGYYLADDANNRTARTTVPDSNNTHDLNIDVLGRPAYQNQVTLYLIEQTNGRTTNTTREVVDEDGLDVGDSYTINPDDYTPAGYTNDASNATLDGSVNPDGSLSNGSATWIYNKTVNGGGNDNGNGNGGQIPIIPPVNPTPPSAPSSAISQSSNSSASSSANSSNSASSASSSSNSDNSASSSSDMNSNSVSHHKAHKRHAAKHEAQKSRATNYSKGTARKINRTRMNAHNNEVANNVNDEYGNAEPGTAGHTLLVSEQNAKKAKAEGINNMITKSGNASGIKPNASVNAHQSTANKGRLPQTNEANHTSVGVMAMATISALIGTLGLAIRRRFN